MTSLPPIENFGGQTQMRLGLDTQTVMYYFPHEEFNNDHTKMPMRKRMLVEEFTEEWVESLIHKNLIKGDDLN